MQPIFLVVTVTTLRYSCPTRIHPTHCILWLRMSHVVRALSLVLFICKSDNGHSVILLVLYTVHLAVNICCRTQITPDTV